MPKKKMSLRRKKPYKGTIEINTLNSDNWKRITRMCNHRVASMETLINCFWNNKTTANGVSPKGFYIR